MRRWLFAFAGLALACLAALWLAGRGALGSRDSDRVEPRAPARAGPADASEILFGDLHVHTTLSFDAFFISLGEGAHPVPDACDFARHCAALDFWSINDHAANLTPQDWKSTVAAIRACEARAGDPGAPDLVSFLGWEWTQAGNTREEHYGHKNVVLAHTDAARIPTRPIAAPGRGTAANPPPTLVRGAMALFGPARFRDAALRWTEIPEMRACPEGPAAELPASCHEVAATPADLFRKLDEWGHEAIVIPHGTTWGIYSPPGSDWSKQLRGAMHDPDRQTLLEIYSGHGSADVARAWRAVERGPDGVPRCPPARPDYLPMCRRAGQLVRGRCLDAGEDDAECERRAEAARRHAIAAGVSVHATVPGSTPDDWLDAGQCRDCDQPAFKYRPAGAAQYIAALGDFADDASRPRRFRFGFLASSDIHTGRAGSGYKEVARSGMTDGRDDPGEGSALAQLALGGPEEPVPHSRSLEEAAGTGSRLFGLFETERPNSFLYTGGLVAAHARGRSREAIWSALARREVYGTSGPRILLWFDLVNAPQPEPVAPMGSEVALGVTPRFRVRALGALEQRPGCPTEAVEALGEEEVRRLCLGECHHPGERRRPITRVEVVRIRPQLRPEEIVESLVEDPWRAFSCPLRADGGCEVEFEDPDFVAGGRETVYYVRALQAPEPTINGDPLRCDRDPDGACVRTRPCGFSGIPHDECLGPHASRAWSSPIYLDPVSPP